MREKGQQPANTDPLAWKEYWKENGQPWRREPLISAQRQEILKERRETKRDLKRGVYPFSKMRLDRSDIEWLLDTHEGGLGPVNWYDPTQHDREGLDLRGADLRDLDLSYLPMARSILGLTQDEWWNASDDQKDAEATHLERARMAVIHLEGAQMRYTHLEGSIMIYSFLQGASLRYAHLDGAILDKTTFDKDTNFDEVSLSNKTYGSVELADVNWGDSSLGVVDWGKLKILGDEEHARIVEKHLARYHDIGPGIRLTDEESRLIPALIALSRDSKQRRSKELHLQRLSINLKNYKRAVRAYREIAIQLRQQGLNEDGDRFAFNGIFLQRKVLKLQKKWSQYAGSFFLDMIAGYGYKPIRTLIAYLFVIVGFSLAFIEFGTVNGHIFTLHEALIFSLTSGHGRGFFPGGLGLDNPVTTIAALEAVIGLLIEVSFIATFTQRFFAK